MRIVDVGLKGNQPYLHDLARDFGQYDLRAPLARAAERYRGHTIVRELHARDVASEPAAAIEAAEQLWYVCQTTTDRRGEIVAVEQRYFVTSIPTDALTRDQELVLPLKLVDGDAISLAAVHRGVSGARAGA